MACLKIFLFSWAILFKKSTPGEINEGFIYTSMVFAMILGTHFYELLIVYLNFNYYNSLAGCLFLQGVVWFLTYFVDSFLSRVLFLSIFNGLIGFYNPINTIINSNIFIEKYKYLVLKLFRIPTDIYLIIILISLRYLNFFTVAIIEGSMCFIAFFIAIFLINYLRINQQKKEKIE